MENHEGNKNQCNDYYFQALLAEYNVIRSSSLSRDTVKQTIENFIVIIIAALIASYTVIIKENLILIFPIVSIILTSLALTRHKQHMLLYRLSEYEIILQKNLIEFVKLIPIDSNNLPPNINLLWNWQNYFKISTKLEKSKTIPGYLNRGISSLSSVLPLFMALIFLIHRPLFDQTKTEFLVFIIALVYSFALLIIALTDYSNYLKKNRSSC